MVNGIKCVLTKSHHVRRGKGRREGGYSLKHGNQTCPCSCSLRRYPLHFVCMMFIRAAFMQCGFDQTVCLSTLLVGLGPTPESDLRQSVAHLGLE